MKRLLLLLLLVGSFNANAQDSATVGIDKFKLSFGKTVTIDDWSIEFKALSPDSRCPEEVTCIRGGEAVVTLNIYKGDVLKKELTIAFYPYSNSDGLTKYLDAEGIKISNLQLFPYPKADLNQINDNYCMHFDHLLIEGE